MHLIFITSPFRVGSGVAERIVLELIRRLIRMNVEITVLQPGDKINFYTTSVGINVYEHPSPSFRGKKLESLIIYANTWKYVGSLTNKILDMLRERNDVIIVSTRFYNILPLVLEKKVVSKYPLVIYELNHYPWVEDVGYFYYSLGRRFLSVLDRSLLIKIAGLVLEKATKVVAVSNTIKRWIEDTVPAASGKITVIYNPVDTTLFSPDANGRVLAEKLSLEGRRVVLHVGTDHLVIRKGLHYAIKTLAKLPKDVALVVTGYRHVPSINKIYMNYIMHLISKYQLRDRVYFVGWVPYKELARYFNISKLLLYPTIQEGFGVPIIEAMASARPVVGFDIPPVNELVENGRTGILVQLGNVEKLAEAVRIILDDESLWEKMCISAREEAVKRFSIDEIVHAHLKLYEEIASISFNLNSDILKTY
jgi:glycosyltransferase involved in cell wall biosynthesis